MTAMTLEPTVLTPEAAPALEPAAIAALRRRAMEEMDAPVRATIHHRLVDDLITTFAPRVERTTYDTVYAATPSIGGHWTVGGSRFGLFTVQTNSYLITLEFDGRQRPACFHVHGRSTVVSEDATVESLDRALRAARRSGPLSGWAPGFVPGVAL